MDVLSFTKQKSVGSLLIVILNHMMIMKICFVYMKPNKINIFKNFIKSIKKYQINFHIT